MTGDLNQMSRDLSGSVFGKYMMANEIENSDLFSGLIEHRCSKDQ